jgi:hypothetical protein
VAWNQSWTAGWSRVVANNLESLKTYRGEYIIYDNKFKSRRGN